ncbi:MAG: hypothetical protein ACI4K6_04645 [Candidatus Fimenecus sp.]
MEKVYFDRLRKMKCFCFCEIMLLLCIGVGSIAAVLFCIGKQWLWFAVAVALIAALITLLVLYNKRMRRAVGTAPYVLKLNAPLSKETVFAKLQTQPHIQKSKVYSENGMVLFIKKALHIRLLAVYLPNFSKSEFDRVKKRLNAKINKDFAIPHTISRFEAEKAVRVNLVLTEAVNAQLYAFLNRNAAESMRRVEGVLNIGVDLNQGMIFIPAMFGDCLFSNIRKYERCVKKLCALTGIPYHCK